MHRLNRAVLPGMRERGSSLLVHLSSAMGRTIIPFAAPYTATKFAIEGLAESLHYELAGTGVDVAIVQPGAFATSFQDNVQEPADTERVASYGRLADRSAAFWNSYSEQIGFSECVPDPKLVADVIVRLGESPRRKQTAANGHRSADRRCGRAGDQPNVRADPGRVSALVRRR